MNPLFVALFGSALAAGPTGPGVTVKYVVPPTTLVKGVTTLEVQPFSGRRGEPIAAEIVAALADTERLATDAAAVTKEVLKQGKDVAADLAAGAVGGGIQGALVKNLTKTAVGTAENRLDIEPLVLDDGLRVDVFQVVPSGGSAKLTGTVKVSESTEDFKRTETKRDSNGNVVTNSDGKPMKIEVPCRRRSVVAQVNWRVASGGTEIAAKSFERKGGDSRCGSEISKLASANDIADRALVGAGTGVVRRMAPSWKVKRLPLSKSKAVKSSLQLIRMEDWGGAFCAFYAAAQANPNDYASVHGHGVMLEAYGHFDAATAQLEAAQAIKSTKMSTKALERAVKHKVQVMTLVDTYGLTYAVPDAPDFTACGAK